MSSAPLLNSQLIIIIVIILLRLLFTYCLQCFDTVGWAAGRASGLQKTECWSAGMLSACSEVQTCIYPSWCHCHSLSLASVKSRLVLPFWLVAWHSGRTSVSGRRTIPVLRSTCSWWVTTNVGKPSAIGQPTRPTLAFHPFGVDKMSSKLESDVCCRLQVAPSGESYESKRRPGRKQRQTTAGYMAWFTSRHLRADCLYTGISSGPNAR